MQLTFYGLLIDDDDAMVVVFDVTEIMFESCRRTYLSQSTTECVSCLVFGYLCVNI